VQTVAAATEQLTATVSEITRQVAQAGSGTRAAVEDSRRSDATMQGLAEAPQVAFNGALGGLRAA
jgi:methyl-accepting chemotaxis protein